MQCIVVYHSILLEECIRTIQPGTHRTAIINFHASSLVEAKSQKAQNYKQLNKQHLSTYGTVTIDFSFKSTNEDALQVITVMFCSSKTELKLKSNSRELSNGFCGLRFMFRF